MSQKTGQRSRKVIFQKNLQFVVNEAKKQKINMRELAVKICGEIDRKDMKLWGIGDGRPLPESATESPDPERCYRWMRRAVTEGVGRIDSRNVDWIWGLSCMCGCTPIDLFSTTVPSAKIEEDVQHHFSKIWGGSHRTLRKQIELQLLLWENDLELEEWGKKHGVKEDPSLDARLWSAERLLTILKSASPRIKERIRESIKEWDEAVREESRNWRRVNRPPLEDMTITLAEFITQKRKE